MTGQIKEITLWQEVEINFQSYQVASIPFEQFFEDQNYRLVVMREKNKDGQGDLFTGDDFIYRSILTPMIHESSEPEVITYYNMRGASEKTFDIQNNDSGWGRLPCSDMNYNPVYLILTAMIKNFYNEIFFNSQNKLFTDLRW